MLYFITQLVGNDNVMRALFKNEGCNVANTHVGASEVFFINDAVHSLHSNTMHSVDQQKPYTMTLTIFSLV